jgi:hypothetical protein
LLPSVDGSIASTRHGIRVVNFIVVDELIRTVSYTNTTLPGVEQHVALKRNTVSSFVSN